MVFVYSWNCHCNLCLKLQMLSPSTLNYKDLGSFSLYSTMAEGGRSPLLISCTVEKRGNNSSHPRWLRTS
uniref:Uncharacterized protein n=1 Tax=Lotus japonicus TaxID=34305 RepID=I3SGU4_LOTJA|nr:unknown [Lotus japonicus]